MAVLHRFASACASVQYAGEAISEANRLPDDHLTIAWRSSDRLRATSAQHGQFEPHSPGFHGGLQSVSIPDDRRQVGVRSAGEARRSAGEAITSDKNVYHAPAPLGSPQLASLLKQTPNFPP
jgi:hypothetical protein